MPKYTDEELANMARVADGAQLMTAATIHFAAEHITAFAGWLDEAHDGGCTGLCGGEPGHVHEVPRSKVRDILAEAHALNGPHCDRLDFADFEEDLEYDADGNVTGGPAAGRMSPDESAMLAVNLTSLTREDAAEWPPELRSLVASRCLMAIPQAREQGHEAMAARLEEIAGFLAELNA